MEREKNVRDLDRTGSKEALREMGNFELVLGCGNVPSEEMLDFREKFL